MRVSHQKNLAYHSGYHCDVKLLTICDWKRFLSSTNSAYGHYEQILADNVTSGQPFVSDSARCCTPRNLTATQSITSVGTVELQFHQQVRIQLKNTSYFIATHFCVVSAIAHLFLMVGVDYATSVKRAESLSF
jgi:hypothetical protein